MYPAAFAAQLVQSCVVALLLRRTSLEKVETMSGLLPAITGGVVRAIMAFAAGHGIELGNDQAETIVQGLLAVGSVVWTVVQKMQADKKTRHAAATGMVP